MSSLPVTPEPTQPQRLVVLRKLIRSRWTFVTLQVLDLVTTLTAFHLGAFEVNPMVAHLTVEFGRVGGAFVSKVICVVIALGVKRLLWVVNLFYAGVVCWNVVVLILMSLRMH
jgi:Domain of unknown function (DUF5658)